jgi:hypothetical protein
VPKGAQLPRHSSNIDLVRNALNALQTGQPPPPGARADRWPKICAATVTNASDCLLRPTSPQGPGPWFAPKY